MNSPFSQEKITNFLWLFWNSIIMQKMLKLSRILFMSFPRNGVHYESYWPFHSHESWERWGLYRTHLKNRKAPKHRCFFIILQRFQSLDILCFLFENLIPQQFYLKVLHNYFSWDIESLHQDFVNNFEKNFAIILVLLKKVHS